MKLHWKLIAFEVVLELILELGPASLSMMAAIAEYLVDLSHLEHRASVQLIIRSMELNTARRESISYLSPRTFSTIPNPKII
jgi:hypothetical protein